MAGQFCRVLMVTVFLLVSSESFAQAGKNAKGMPGAGPRQQMATIIYAGLGGAVLGLSTLSFYDRPQEKLSNIAIGFALGIISGTVITTYKTATQPYGRYNDQMGMMGTERQFLDYKTSGSEVPLQASYRWEF